jgi:hypothetical protein
MGCSNVYNSSSATDAQTKGWQNSICSNFNQHLNDFRTGFLKNRIYFFIGTVESFTNLVSNIIHVAFRILWIPITLAKNTMTLVVPEPVVDSTPLVADHISRQLNPHKPAHIGRLTLTQKAENPIGRIVNLIAKPSNWIITKYAQKALTNFVFTINGVIGVVSPVAAYAIDRKLGLPIVQLLNENGAQTRTLRPYS